MSLVFVLFFGLVRNLAECPLKYLSPSFRPSVCTRETTPEPVPKIFSGNVSSHILLRLYSLKGHIL